MTKLNLTAAVAVTALILSAASAFAAFRGQSHTFGAYLLSTVGTSTLPGGLNLSTGCFTQAGGTCVGSAAAQKTKVYSIASTTAATFAKNVTGSSKSIYVPAGTMTGSTTISFFSRVTCVNTGTFTNNCIVKLTDADGDNLAICTLTVGTSETGTALIHALVSANGSTTRQYASGSYVEENTGLTNLYLGSCDSTSAANLSSAQSFKMTIFATDNAGNTATINSFSIVVHP